ncbi:hypothetical protein HDU97_010357 [Phlyctochytrium planicorne]|nr:hypothetical protein HDU97_010357 [Phlyctochytrium planicorne]
MDWLIKTIYFLAGVLALYYLTKNVIHLFLFERLSKIGVRVQTFGLWNGIHRLSFSPKPSAATTKHKKLALGSISIETIRASLSNFSSKDSCWIRLNVAKVRVVLVATPDTAGGKAPGSPKGPSRNRSGSSPKSGKSEGIFNPVAAAAYVVNLTIVRQIVRVLGMKVSDLEIELVDGDKNRIGLFTLESLDIHFTTSSTGIEDAIPHPAYMYRQISAVANVSHFEFGHHRKEIVKPMFFTESQCTIQAAVITSLLMGKLESPLVEVIVNGIRVDLTTVAEFAASLKASQVGGPDLSLESLPPVPNFPPTDHIMEQAGLFFELFTSFHPILRLSISDIVLTFSSNSSFIKDSEYVRFPSLLAGITKLEGSMRVFDKINGTSETEKAALSASKKVVGKIKVFDLNGDVVNEGSRDGSTMRLLSIPDTEFSAELSRTIATSPSEEGFDGQLGVIVNTPKLVMVDTILARVIILQTLSKMEKQPSSKVFRKEAFVAMSEFVAFVLSKVAVSARLQILSPNLGMRLTQYNPLGRDDVDVFCNLNIAEISAKIQNSVSTTPASVIKFAKEGDSAKTENFKEETAGPLSFDGMLTIGNIGVSIVETTRSKSELSGTLADQIQLAAIQSIGFEFGLWIPPVKELFSFQAITIVSCSVSVKSVLLDLSSLGSSKLVDFFSLAICMRNTIDHVQTTLAENGFKKVIKPTVVTIPKMDTDLFASNTISTSTVSLKIEEVRVIVSETGTFGSIVFLQSAFAELAFALNTKQDVDLPSIVAAKFSPNLFFTRLELSGEFSGIVARSFNNLMDPSTASSEPLAAIEKLGIFAEKDFNKQEPFPISITCEQATILFQFWSYYAAILSVVPAIKIAKLLTVAPSRPKLTRRLSFVESTEIPKDLLVVKLKEIQVVAIFTGGSKLRGFFHNASAFVKSNQAVYATIASASVEALTDVEADRWDELASVVDFSASVHKPKPVPGSPPVHIGLRAQTIALFNPHGFLMSQVFDDIINTSKGLKNVVFKALGIQSSSESLASGRTRILPEQIPSISVAVASVTLCLYDSDFESSLSINYRKGLEEQVSRMAREKAFQKKAASMLENKDITKEISQKEMESIENAWWLLEEFNAKAWIDKIKKTMPRERRPVMKAVVANISADCVAPILPHTYLEESLHIIDKDTPGDRVYDELIPRNVRISLEEAIVTLRDHHLPLVHIPKSSTKSWKTEGLIVIAEPSSLRESKRRGILPLAPLPPTPAGETFITVTRQVNPVKVYTQTKTTLTTSSAITVNWGAAVEPCIGDMIRIIDSFTKPTIDPSPPIGWWDKLRLIVHGTNSINVTGGGCIRLRILGSNNPYFDARSCHGIEGLEIAVSKGIQVEVGGQPAGSNEDIVIECGQLVFSLPLSKIEREKPMGSRRIAVDEDVIGTFNGGVRVSLGFMFKCLDPETGEEILAPKTHAQVSLKHPDYVPKGPDGKYVDSLAGFRTKNIDINVNIQSPRPFFSALTNPMNAVCLSGGSMRKLQKFIAVYQSPLTIMPIQRGNLFGLNPVLKKPKLGKAIGNVSVNAIMFPLVFSFMNELPEGTGGVGIRCRVEKMEAQLRVRQNQNQGMPSDQTPTGPAAPASGKVSRANRWLLDSSEVELSELEGRVLSFDTETMAEDAEAGNQNFFSIEEKREWLLDIDFEYLDDIKILSMTPFVWSPKVVYYKRDSLTKRNISSTQIDLYQVRLREIDASIRHYLEVQKGLEYRMTIFFDDSLRQQSNSISDKMEILHLKKNAIEKKLKSLKISAENNSMKDQFSEYGHGSAFNHLYIVHNLRFLWKNDIRNAVFKFFDILERDSSLRFCLSSAALKTVFELISANLNRTFPDIDLISPGASRDDLQRSSASLASVKVDPVMAKELLQKMMNLTGSQVLIQNETFNEERADSTEDMHLNSNLGSRFSVYTPSAMPESLDYVPPGQRVESGYVIQLINPQINLVSARKDFEEDIHSVLVVAENMLLRSISILDQGDVNGGALDSRNRDVDLIKKRTILNFHKAQFLVARKLDLEIALESDIDTLLTYQRLHAAKDTHETIWPLWVPLECLVDLSCQVDYMHRIVDQTSACFYRDKPNPLYVTRSSTHSKNFNADQTDFIFIAFEDFVISMTSAQYLIFFDVITNLLVYKDPIRQARIIKLRRMMLALQQMDNLHKVMETVLRLQEKIKNADFYLRFGHATLPKKEEPVMSTLDIRKSLIQYQDELYVLINALKGLHDLEAKKKSLEVAFKLETSARNLEWFLMDKEDKIAQLTFSNSRFSWLYYDDQSSLNTLEIDKVYIDNLLQNSGSFRNMLGPFSAESKAVDFHRNKMLRVYWRELAPVAGIPVVDHLEINFFPLVLQLTRDIGKNLEHYFFPGKKQKSLVKSNTISGSVDDSAAAKPLLPVKFNTFSSNDDASSKTASVSGSESTRTRRPGSARQNSARGKNVDELKEMQMRAAQNRSFIYVKVPGVQHCISYRGAKEKNIEDLNLFSFRMPTLEYRNKAWGWQDLFAAVKKDAIRAVLANTGALVREKLFQNLRKGKENAGADADDTMTLDIDSPSISIHPASDNGSATDTDTHHTPSVYSVEERKKHRKLFAILGRKKSNRRMAGGSEVEDDDASSIQ